MIGPSELKFEPDLNMSRIRKCLAGLFSRRNRSSEERDAANCARCFGTQHRGAPPYQVIIVHSEFTPGLGRKVPEMVAAGGGLCEMRYRMDWGKKPGAILRYASKTGLCYH